MHEIVVLNAGFAQHHSDWNFKDVLSPFLRVFCPVEGEATLKLGGQAVALRPNNVYLIPPYVRHGYECVGDFSLFYLHLYERYTNIDADITLFESASFPVTFSDPEGKVRQNVSEICDILPSLSLRNYDPQTYDNNTELMACIKRYCNLPLSQRYTLEGLAFGIIGNILAHSVEKEWIKNGNIVDALKYINSNLERALSLSEIAENVCLSESYFIRLFRNLVKIPPMQYVVMKRIERAVVYLLETNLRINEIARKIGYEDVRYFNRVFKKIMGVTPSQCRKG